MGNGGVERGGGLGLAEGLHLRVAGFEKYENASTHTLLTLKT